MSGPPGRAAGEADEEQADAGNQRRQIERRADFPALVAGLLLAEGAAGAVMRKEATSAWTDGPDLLPNTASRSGLGDMISSSAFLGPRRRIVLPCRSAGGAVRLLLVRRGSTMAFGRAAARARLRGGGWRRACGLDAIALLDMPVRMALDRADIGYRLALGRPGCADQAILAGRATARRPCQRNLGTRRQSHHQAGCGKCCHENFAHRKLPKKQWSLATLVLPVRTCLSCLGEARCYRSG